MYDHHLSQAMALLNSKNWTQGNAVLSGLNEASPKGQTKEKR
jgi:hypothetical protein